MTLLLPPQITHNLQTYVEKRNAKKSRESSLTYFASYVALSSMELLFLSFQL